MIWLLALCSHSGETIFYSGHTDGYHHEGVGILVDKQTRKSLLEWSPVTSRIIRARFFSRYAKTTIIQCYAPTQQAEEEEKDLFYIRLQEEILKTPCHDILILMGDFNAEVGSNNDEYEACMGREGVGERNDNGQRFVDLCLENGLVIGGTIFQHKTIHKLTWISPDGKTRNQIDHIVINRKWRGSLLDTRVSRSADVGGDHHRVLSKLQIKLRKMKKVYGQQIFDSRKLKEPSVKAQFILELSKKFQLLNDLRTGNINTICDNVEKVYVEASKTVLGYKRREWKVWISDHTYKLIEERKIAKLRMLTGSGEQQKAANEEYREKNKAVKRSVRKDKRDYITSLSREAQSAAMLKADLNMSAGILEELFNKAWEEEKVPEAWKKGIIVKLPKKGDLSLCDNWRGINLLSVLGKVFCRVLLQRIRQAVEEVLREEQTGFRSGRGCVDQIFVLRMIMEQSLEWNSPLFINYLDFKKAFDSIRHPSLWNILKTYGFPPKVINILKDMYADNKCCVHHEGQWSEWFHVRTGVRQGCVISPILFLVVIDWVMRKATE
ncbi:uncharacterized protein LOC120409474, partial [Mauremys reevesii]|uniref:uncharacterized protein LOC120409474 n=1 Tax=Mauremys reevesii TaxID=260615 RepID=UPI00193FB98D